MASKSKFERTTYDCINSYFNKDRIYDDVEKAEFFCKCSADFEFFFKHVIGLAVGEYHKQLFEMLKNQRICLLSPRGHAKTEIFSVAYSVWKSTYNNYHNTVIVSNTEKQAQRIIKRVKDKIDSNELLSTMKPAVNKRNYTWSKSTIVLGNGSQIMATCLTDSIRGDRIDLCICDDILKKELSDQSKITQDFHDIVEPATDNPESQLIVVGTTVSRHDLFHELAQKGTGYVFKKFMCCERIDGGLLKGKVLFPERWTLKRLQEKYNSMGPTSFRKEYMSDPIQTGELLYPHDLVQNAVDNELEQMSGGRGGCEYWMGVDVALSSDKKADRTAFVIIEKRPGDTTLYNAAVIQPSRGTPTHELFSQIKHLNQQFRFKRILIEDKGNSMSLVEDLQRDFETGKVTEPFITTHKEKDRILMKMQPMMKNGTLKLLNVALLLTELESMGVKGEFRLGRFHEKLESLTGHDDTVMALALAVEAATSKVGQVGAIWI